MPGADSLIPGGLGGEWVEAGSDEHGCKTKALRRVLAGHGKEQQHSIGAMGADIYQLNVPNRLLTNYSASGWRQQAARLALGILVQFDQPLRLARRQHSHRQPVAKQDPVSRQSRHPGAR